MLQDVAREGKKVYGCLGCFKCLFGVYPVRRIFVAGDFGREGWRPELADFLDGRVAEAREGSVDVDQETMCC